MYHLSGSGADFNSLCLSIIISENVFLVQNKMEFLFARRSLHPTVYQLFAFNECLTSTTVYVSRDLQKSVKFRLLRVFSYLTHLKQPTQVY